MTATPLLETLFGAALVGFFNPTPPKYVIQQVLN